LFFKPEADKNEKGMAKRKAQKAGGNGRYYILKICTAWIIIFLSKLWVDKRGGNGG